MTSADSSSHRRSEHLLGFNISPEEASLTRGASTKEAEDALSRWGQQVSVCERRRRREERYLWRAVVSMVSVCCVVRNVRFESVCRRRHHHLHPPTYCSSQWHHCQQDTNSPAAETPTLRSRRRTVNCGACLEADQSTNTSWGAQIFVKTLPANSALTQGGSESGPRAEVGPQWGLIGPVRSLQGKKHPKMSKKHL